MIVLVIAGLIGITLAAYLTWIGNQNRLAVRSQSWNAALPLMEAGIEEALAHLNSSPATWATNGFALANNVYAKRRDVTEGYYLLEISTNISTPTITCWSYHNSPLKAGYIKRGVRVTCLRTYSSGGLLVKNQIIMSGGSRIDSFGSCDPAQSGPGGVYDISKSSDHVTVASTAGTADAIHVGTAEIYGKVAVGPGGTATVAGGSVGDMAWHANGNTGFQPGSSSSDSSISISNVDPPSLGGAFSLPPGGTVNGTNYVRIFTGGTYLIGAIQFSAPGLVTAPTTIYCSGAFKISGSGFIRIAPGASLKVYVAAGEISVSGGGVVNDTLVAANCSFFGMPTCDKVTVSGSGAYIGSITAPSASATLSGSAGYFGSLTTSNATLSGGAAFHYDTCLGGNAKQPYSPNSWTEL